MSHSIDIRSAAIGEMDQVIAVVVAAFVADPPARFAWPSANDYLTYMPQATHAFAGSCFAQGTVDVSGDLRGAALWLPPGVEPEGTALEMMFRQTAAPAHLGDLLSTFNRMQQSHPREPHWYLPQIGVDPAGQGTGIGSALMRHGLARCDRDQALAYLEASKPSNIPFYKSHGFEVTEEIQVGLGPPITAMARKPRPQA